MRIAQDFNGPGRLLYASCPIHRLRLGNAAMPLVLITGLFFLTLALQAASAEEPKSARTDHSRDGLKLRVEAGVSPRSCTPFSVDLDREDLPPSVRSRLGAEPIALVFRASGARGPERTITLEARAASSAGNDRVHLTGVLDVDVPAGSACTIAFEQIGEPLSARPWQITERPDGLIDLKNRERTVFRYNAGPSSHPNYGPVYTRSAYIHPAFTPTGALITGDFSRFHPHHRGFFLAYTKTRFGKWHPDFWNIQGKSGRIVCERVELPCAGPVTARLRAHHRWEVPDGPEVLHEQWELEAYDVPGQPYWLFDLTSTQQAVGSPLELVPYRYGGMAYRGPDPFVKGPLDVLTSEGSGRRDRDQKPARWVDLTGPIEDGSSQYAGAMMADHPANVHHPTVARIHPTLLPFFCYVPAHDKPVTIGTDEPTVFRYRILIHDGRPDRALDEHVWRDFAEPPRVTVVRGE